MTRLRDNARQGEFVYAHLLVICAMFFAFCAVVAQANTKKSIKVRVAPGTQTVRLGEPIRISVEVTNLASHSIWLAQDKSHDAMFEYLVGVTPETGETPIITKAYAQISGSQAPRSDLNQPFVIVSSPFSICVRPGGEITDRTDVAKLFAIEAPGRFKVQLQRRDPETAAIARSNIVTVIVLGNAKSK